MAQSGQHFKQASAAVAFAVTLDFLRHLGLLERAKPAAAAPRRFELLSTHVIAHADFRFARPVIGFETFAEDELIATVGPLETRAPCADCTIFMPAR